MGRLGLAMGLSLACIVGAAFAAMVMIGFGCLSFYFYMTTVTTQALAALAVAGLGLFLAILMAVLVLLVPWPSVLSLLASQYKGVGRLADALEIGRHLGSEGRAFMKSNISGGAIAAFSFGIAMGANPRLRKAVFRFLRR